MLVLDWTATWLNSSCLQNSCLEKWPSWLIPVTHETSSTMRGATGVTLQHHQNCACHEKRPACLILVTYMKRYLQCAEQQELPSNITKYCACHEKWLSWLVLVTYETLYTARGATEVIPSNITKYFACHEKWLSWLILVAYMNVIYIAWSNRGYIPSPTSPNTAPATTNSSPKFLTNFPKLHLYNAGPIRPWSEHGPRMKPSVCNPPRNRRYFLRAYRAFSAEKCNISRSSYHSKFHQMLHPPRKVAVELHQIVVHLPRRVTLELHKIVRLPRKASPNILYSITILLLYYSLTLLFSTLLDSSLLFSTLYYSLHYSTLPYYSLLLYYYSLTLLLFSYSAILYSTRLFFTSLYFSLLYSTLLYPTVLFSTILFSTLLLFSTILYSTLPYTTLHYSTILLLYDSHILVSYFIIILYSIIDSATLRSRSYIESFSSKTSFDYFESSDSHRGISKRVFNLTCILTRHTFRILPNQTKHFRLLGTLHRGMHIACS